MISKNLKLLFYIGSFVLMIYLISKVTKSNSAGVDYTERCEKAFDRMFSYERELTETFQYRKVMLKGTAMQRADIIVTERSFQTKQINGQSQILEQNQREKKSLCNSKKLNQGKSSVKKEVLVCNGLGM